jgi:peptidoglycan/LPS O-acetylase OafA/YrhL
MLPFARGAVLWTGLTGVPRTSAAVQRWVAGLGGNAATAGSGRPHDGPSRGAPTDPRPRSSTLWRPRLRAGPTSTRSQIGLAGIAGAIVAFDGQTPYPGGAALLPTLGTAAVIAAGAGLATAGPASVWHDDGVAGRWLSPVPWLSSAPCACSGLLFTWYLWHWPALVLTQEVTGALVWQVQLALVLACGLPAWRTM